MHLNKENKVHIFEVKNIKKESVIEILFQLINVPTNLDINQNKLQIKSVSFTYIVHEDIQLWSTKDAPYVTILDLVLSLSSANRPRSEEPLTPMYLHGSTWKPLAGLSSTFQQWIKPFLKN